MQIMQTARLRGEQERAVTEGGGRASGVDHHIAARREVGRREVALLEGDPPGAEGLEVGAGAAGQPLQPDGQRRGDKDPQVIAGPQVGVAAVGAFDQEEGPGPGRHRPPWAVLEPKGMA